MNTIEIKEKVIEGIKIARKRYPSDAKLAVFLGINGAQLSRIMRGDTTSVLSDAKWISIARKLAVNIGNLPEWVTAETPVYKFIYGQLRSCQDFSLSGLCCDSADIGKTYAAKCYVRENKFAIYIDCSQVKTKQRLIRQICKEFGLDFKGKYAEIYEDLIFYIRSIPNPIIILDEAGDLTYEAFLELKALWNATEKACGWYMMGADGLKRKIDSNLGRKKVGYAEIFSRYGAKYQKISPEGKEDMKSFTMLQISLIAKANGAGTQDVQQIYANTNGSLRRIYTEIQKLKRPAA